MAKRIYLVTCEVAIEDKDGTLDKTGAATYLAGAFDKAVKECDPNDAVENVTAYELADKE